MIALVDTVDMMGLRAFIGAAHRGHGRRYVFPEDIAADRMGNFIMFGSRWEYFGERVAGDSSLDLPVRTGGEHVMQALEDGWYVNVVDTMATDLVDAPRPDVEKVVFSEESRFAVARGASFVLIVGAVRVTAQAGDYAPPFVFNAASSDLEFTATQAGVGFILRRRNLLSFLRDRPLGATL